MSITPPDTTTPLVIEPKNQSANLESLGVLKSLAGTWNSPRGDAATGYNVMPLPQDSAPGGYILKNFRYFEELTFAPIAGNAPNRGGTYTQQASTLFYEQRVYFADNPEAPPADQVQDKLVHAENGALLHLTSVPQQKGAFGPGHASNIPPLPQDPSRAYVKQVSVPHGNTILAVGQAAVIVPTTKVEYPRASRAFLPFSAGGVIDPSDVLEESYAALVAEHGAVESGWMLSLESQRPGGGIQNILFEQRRASVTAFDNYMYQLVFEDGFEALQYLQVISMQLAIRGELVPFLHVDANTLARANG